VQDMGRKWRAGGFCSCVPQSALRQLPGNFALITIAPDATGRRCCSCFCRRCCCCCCCLQAMRAEAESLQKINHQMSQAVSTLCGTRLDRPLLSCSTGLLLFYVQTCRVNLLRHCSWLAASLVSVHFTYISSVSQYIC
jgi:hypothetical protein